MLKHLCKLLLSFFMILLFPTLAFAATYTYDDLNRLTQVIYDSGKTVTYTYDPAGNILSTQIAIAVSPVYQNVSVDRSNTIITLTFTEEIAANGTSLKNAVTLAKDGTTYAPLGSSDTASINGKTLIVTLNTALTGGINKIKIAANSIKDAEGNVLETEVITESIMLNTLPTLHITPNSLYSGDTATITAANFPPNAVLHSVMFGDPSLPGHGVNNITATFDANGSASFNVIVPKGLAATDNYITIWTTGFGGVGEASASCTFTMSIASSTQLKAKPIVKIETNPNYGDSWGIYYGLGDIKSQTGEAVVNSNIAGYQIEVDFDPTKVAILDVVNEGNLGHFTKNVNSTAGKVIVADAAADGTSNYNKLFFLPISLIGSSQDLTSLHVSYIDVKDKNFNKIVVESSPNLEFHRGKIYNEGLSSQPNISDAVAGLQYLAGLIDDGTDVGQVNTVNMASITGPDTGTTIIKPSVKDVIGMMQYLVNMRDTNFQPLNN